MFKSKGLFSSVRCPDETCSRLNCLFSHSANIPRPNLNIRVSPNKAAEAKPPNIVPAKRPSNSFAVDSSAASKRPVASAEPPLKLQKLGPAKRPAAVPTTFHAPSGEPILRLSAAASQVPVTVRQSMIKLLFDHFKVLYSDILQANPDLASDHTLRQEKEVYDTATKTTYRNAIISTIARLKKRTLPDSPSHDSVGTEGDVQEKKDKKAAISSIKLTRALLEPYILSEEEMKTWGYFTEVPQDPGGSNPSSEGKTAKCERCTQPFQVKRKDEADSCSFHWGKPFSRQIVGEKVRVFTCCSRPVSEGGGCSVGPHVFYESSLPDLHSRHSFSMLKEAQEDDADSALPVVALDCEMIYTTGGMRVARVSVVDGSGAEVFDEIVRMDDDVEVICYNTRFSGITEELYSKAVMQLSSIRESLDSLINRSTIIIGHALDNDLKTLRIVHHRCVDTALLPAFRHPQGPPYRRALRQLVKEHLGMTIQTGGATEGHSSVEDSKATLDLVRWFIGKQRAKRAPSANV
ncbi:ribonuclease H-like protein [Pterulicium gracile]|uniref:Ribonuclease H-like protein n=1 Tax=Pterulicium gracile TaxID=1884261 RepID=A0A5C3QWX0_9AGAR|nr:ribonuclease H-like protein [Pterula gracilis]